MPGAAPEVVAGRVIGGGRVLSVLDGFDELPAASRGSAFDELAALHSTRPFVLTSRPGQYRQQVLVDSDFLRSEIVLPPLSSAAVGQYLSAGGRRTRWLDVVDRPVDHDDRTREVVLLRRALDVPLMAGLARVAYADGSHPDDWSGRAGSAPWRRPRATYTRRTWTRCTAPRVPSRRCAAGARRRRPAGGPSSSRAG
ncbi:hypothetical protein ACFYS8_17615 [Kitasatospora sp. NPDC004615]|uniref:hypothetical protein n=1 Tax=Kitasatospora sp. NPDC004615 TaxID=3364017 RepID=UPI00367A26E4